MDEGAGAKTQKTFRLKVSNEGDGPKMRKFLSQKDSNEGDGMTMEKAFSERPAVSPRDGVKMQQTFSARPAVSASSESTIPPSPRRQSRKPADEGAGGKMQETVSQKASNEGDEVSMHKPLFF